MSSSAVVPIGRRITPLCVWKLTAAPMLGCATQKSTIARTSGSLVGYGPAPTCSNSWRHSDGKLRFRSRPSRSRLTLTRTPSQALMLPSGMTRKYSPPISPGSRAIIRRGSCGCFL